MYFLIHFFVLIVSQSSTSACWLFSCIHSYIGKYCLLPEVTFAKHCTSKLLWKLLKSPWYIYIYIHGTNIHPTVLQLDRSPLKGCLQLVVYQEYHSNPQLFIQQDVVLVFQVLQCWCLQEYIQLPTWSPPSLSPLHAGGQILHWCGDVTFSSSTFRNNEIFLCCLPLPVSSLKDCLGPSQR